MELSNASGSGEQLYEMDAGDLGAQDLVGAYEDAYGSAMVRIRAVGDIISRGKKPRNLLVAMQSMSQNVADMIKIHNQAGPLLAAESHCCCDRPRSEVMRAGVHITDWTFALGAIAISAAGISETDNPNKTLSMVRSVTTLAVGAMHVVQGWFSGQTFEQIAYEEDLFRLMKDSAGRIRYVKSMIATFEAWQTLQAHESDSGQSTIDDDVDSLITALEAVPVRQKSVSDQSRRDILEAFLKTRMGDRMITESRKLQGYRRLVAEEYQRGESKLVVDDAGDESEDVMDNDVPLDGRNAHQFLKDKRAERSPMLRARRKHLDVEVEVSFSPKSRSRGSTSSLNRATYSRRKRNESPTPSLTAEVLDEYIQSKFCFYVNWNIPRVVSKFETKYRIVQNETSAVGRTLKNHDATEIDFQSSIATLREALGPIRELEKIAQYILNSDSKIPTATGFRAQQQYRTIIQLLLTGGSFAISTVESVLEYKEEEANQTLKTIAFAALILGQVGARWDNRLQGQVFTKMRDQQILRSVLSKKHSQTTKALIKYWESCQKALTSGHDSDVERAFATRVPRPIALECSVDDVAHHIVAAHKKRTQCQPKMKRSMLPTPVAMCKPKSMRDTREGYVDAAMSVPSPSWMDDAALSMMDPTTPRMRSMVPMADDSVGLARGMDPMADDSVGLPRSMAGYEAPTMRSRMGDHDQIERAESRFSDFDARVLQMVESAKRSSHGYLFSPEGTPSAETTPATPVVAPLTTIVEIHPAQRLQLWDEVDSDDDIPEGDWELRLRELDKHEAARRQTRLVEKEPARSAPADNEPHNRTLSYTTATR